MKTWVPDVEREVNKFLQRRGEITHPCAGSWHDDKKRNRVASHIQPTWAGMWAVDNGQGYINGTYQTCKEAHEAVILERMREEIG